ncbi:MAG: large conductance mechanosensitive channel protein MscL [Candidatus Izemoplasmatales bacterium]
MGKFFKEFRDFIAKGNALDLAVGLIIGTAFNAIVKSLVADIITPLISLLFKADLSNLYAVLRGTATYDAVTGSLILSEDAILLTYGNFIMAVLDFFIIALSIFVAIKAITKLSKRIQQAKDLIKPKEEPKEKVEE